MKLGEIVDKVFVDPRKLTHYALEPESPAGKHKAVLFEKLLGFTKQNAGDLVEQLQTRAPSAEAILRSEDVYGKRYRVDLLVEGTEGRQAIVRTGWLVPPETRTAHLVTLYVKKR